MYTPSSGRQYIEISIDTVFFFYMMFLKSIKYTHLIDFNDKYEK